MELVAYSPEVWMAFQSWFEARGTIPPPAAPNVTFVAHEGELVCGCCYYLGDPPYMFVEHLSTNPDQPARINHMGVSYLARVMMALATSQNRTLLCLVRHKGIAQILYKAGCKVDPVYVMYSLPGSPIKSAPQRSAVGGKHGDESPQPSPTNLPRRKGKVKRAKAKV